MTQEDQPAHLRYIQMFEKLRHQHDGRVVVAPTPEIFAHASQLEDVRAVILSRSHKKMTSFRERLAHFWNVTRLSNINDILHVNTTIAPNDRVRLSEDTPILRYEQHIREEFCAMAHALKGCANVLHGEIFVSGTPTTGPLHTGITNIQCSWFESGFEWPGKDKQPIKIAPGDWLFTKPGFDVISRERDEDIPRVVISIIPDFRAQGPV